MSSGAFTDVDLLQRYLGGDDEAFIELVRRHKDRLWGVALHLMCSSDEAAGVLSLSLISAAQQAGQHADEEAVLAWLHRVLITTCLARLREGRLVEAVSVADGTGLPTAALDSAQDPDDALGGMHREVHAALQELDSDQRAALVLVDLEGYSIDDASEIMGVTPGTIKSLCSRGRARLAPLLAHVSMP